VTPFENPLKGWLARQALGSCDALTGDSTDILEVCAELGAAPERSHRILWGVDFDLFRPGDEPVWRQRYGFSNDDIVYFSPRSYTQPYYNIDVVIAAAARVHRKLPRARFLFSGYEGDPGPFQNLVEAAGIAEVTAMAGRLPHDEFAVALRACDIFISVPSVDATAVSLLEAMSSGAPVIVSSLASAKEWVTDGDTGQVVPPRDESALVEAMLRLGQDEDLRQLLAGRALVRARELFSFEENMTLVEQVFAGVLDRPGDSPGTIGETVS